MDIFISHLLEDAIYKHYLEQYQLGMETIEFGIGYTLDKKEETLESYKNRMAGYLGKRKLSIHGPFLDLCPQSFDSLVRTVTMERFNDAYDAAVRLGAEHLIYHTCFVPGIYIPDSFRENSIGFWSEFMETKHNGIQIHLENVFDTTYEEIIRIVDAVGHPDFSACLDIGHVHANSPIPVEEWIGAMGTRIGHVHLHNNDGREDEHKALDKGTIPMERILRLLGRECPKANWTLEHNEPLELEGSLRYLNERGYLKK